MCQLPLTIGDYLRNDWSLAENVSGMTSSSTMITGFHLNLMSSNWRDISKSADFLAWNEIRRIPATKNSTQEKEEFIIWICNVHNLLVWTRNRIMQTSLDVQDFMRSRLSLFVRSCPTNRPSIPTVQTVKSRQGPDFLSPPISKPKTLWILFNLGVLDKFVTIFVQEERILL